MYIHAGYLFDKKKNRTFIRIYIKKEKDNFYYRKINDYFKSDIQLVFETASKLSDAEEKKYIGYWHNTGRRNNLFYYYKGIIGIDIDYELKRLKKLKFKLNDNFQKFADECLLEDL